MGRTRFRLFGLALFGSVSPLLIGLGCVSSADGARLTRQNDELRRRVETLEGGLQEQSAAAQTKVQQLEEVLQRATQVVTRASADTGAEVQTMREQLQAQEGSIAELQHELQRLQTEFHEQQADYENRMKKLARRAGIDMPVDDAEIPAAAADHLQAARAAMEARDFSRARALYRAFVTRYPRDERADDAQYQVGHSYMLEDRPATALGELRKVVTDYAQGDIMPAALLDMGDAFYRLHGCTEARAAWDTLLRSHARSPQAAEARNRQRDLQRAPAGYCTS